MAHCPWSKARSAQERARTARHNCSTARTAAHHAAATHGAISCGDDCPLAAPSCATPGAGHGDYIVLIAE